jgi:hypothetical protein
LVRLRRAPRRHCCRCALLLAGECGSLRAWHAAAAVHAATHPPPRAARRTVRDRPHMWATSNSDACSRHHTLLSMMLSLYWIGMDQPANGTILPARARTAARHEGDGAEVDASVCARACVRMWRAGATRQRWPPPARHASVRACVRACLGRQTAP